MLKRRSLCGFLLLMTWVATASAALRINISQGVTAAIPIAVVPFQYQGSGSAPLDVAKVIAQDLKISGSFAPLPRSKMLAQSSDPKKVNLNL